MNKDLNVNVLNGRVIFAIEKIGNPESYDAIIFTMEDGEQYKLFHQQACCEDVTISDICGELDDLIGEPVTVELTVGDSVPDGENEYTTWSFYKFRTRKADVTIAWKGTSNGYYSEEANFWQIK